MIDSIAKEFCNVKPYAGEMVLRMAGKREVGRSYDVLFMSLYS